MIWWLAAAFIAGVFVGVAGLFIYIADNAPRWDP